MDKLNVYRRLLGYLSPYRRQMLFAYGSMLAAAIASLFVPEVIKKAIDNGLASRQPSQLYTAGLFVLGLALVTGTLSFAQMYYGNWLSFRVGYDLRNAFYAAVQRLPFAFHDRAHTGDLMSRAIGDISESERLAGIGVADLASAVLTIIGVTIAMLLQSPRLALIGLIPIPVLAYATIRFESQIRPQFKLIQQQLGVVSTIMQESLTGIRVVKAFAREPHELAKFDRENGDWLARRVQVIQNWGNSWPLFTFLVACSVFLLLLFGGPRAMAGDVSVGTLFALISYVLMLQGPVQRLGFLMNLVATAGASAGRVFEIIDIPDDTADRPDARDLTDVRGAVTFEHVSFGYQDSRPVLQDVSFQAEAGQKIALIGPTGAGKSTIINLIPRFYEPTTGVVRVDGVDIRQVTARSLREHIGIVLQDSFLFSATIAENIAYGHPSADETDIHTAALAARADDFIRRLPQGYQTQVGERGVTLSGGQKQRVAIARALLRDPRILILDDSTSSVDTETEHLIQQALATLMQGRTTFIIAQRLLTLKNADQILVLDGGRIVERGTHAELLAHDGLYRQIYDLQLRDQEAFAALEQV